MPLSQVWDSVREHFFREESLERVALMRRCDWRKEGWFQAELMWLLDQKRGLVSNWQIEIEYPTGNGKKRVDFKIEVAGTSAAVEVKTAICGLSTNGTTYKPRDYGKGECACGVQQLSGMPSPRYLLVFAWNSIKENEPALTNDAWDEMLQAVRSKTSMPGISFVRVPERTPDGKLSIGIFQIP